MTKCRECYDDGYLWTHPSGSDDDKPRFEKCDACDVLRDDLEAKEHADKREYAVVHWHGYQCNKEGKPAMSYMKQEDMTEDQGWFDEDIDKINGLLVSGRYTTGGPIEEVTVYRWK